MNGPSSRDVSGPPELPAIAVAAVSVHFGDKQVLSAVDLTVGQGEWVTVIGPNGAGKSTLLRCVAGSLRFNGSVALRGRSNVELSRRERARLIATVPQHPVVPVGMAVADYVLLGRTPYIRPLGRESLADLRAVDQVLQQLDLIEFSDRPLETLSGGERQRAFIARALAQGASLLLLDEPTSSLDIGHQQEVLDLVDQLRYERGLTVLATMHDLSVAGEYADRMVLLARGLVVASGSPREVLTEQLLAMHYGARVKVIDGDQGPLVIAVRAPASA